VTPCRAPLVAAARTHAHPQHRSSHSTFWVCGPCNAELHALAGGPGGSTARWECTAARAGVREGHKCCAPAKQPVLCRKGKSKKNKGSSSPKALRASKKARGQG
jgi:hypothetical protein